MNRSFLGAVAVSLLVGCGPTVPIKVPEVTPLVEAAPVAVTLRYSPGLRDHHCTGSGGYIAYSWSFALGPPSIEMFDPIFDALFEEAKRDYDASAGRDVVELFLKNFTGCEAHWPIFGRSFIGITYEAVVRSPAGEELARWSGAGFAGPADDLGDPPTTGDPEASYLNALTSIAMRNAAADFIIAFENEPSVQAWLAR